MPKNQHVCPSAWKFGCKDDEVDPSKKDNKYSKLPLPVSGATTLVGKDEDKTNAGDEQRQLDIVLRILHILHVRVNKLIDFNKKMNSSQKYD